jgi:Lrp/AsnC family transcriptional regulator
MTSQCAVLDTIDTQIVDLLQQDGSLSISDLSEKIGMTPPPCWRRVKSLKDRGVLIGQRWDVCMAALGLNVVIFATVKLATHDIEATNAFKQHVKELREVLECYILLGGIDVLVKVVVPDIKYYERFFFQRLSALPAVREITSSVVLTAIKNSSVLPTNLNASDPTR